MAFMKKQVTDKQRWLKIDGTHGITYVPLDVLGINRANFLLLSDEAKLETAKAYYEGRPESTEIIEGYGARMSAPGYMDCTEWAVFETEQAADEYLDEYFGDEDETEADEDEPSEPEEGDYTTSDHRKFYQYGKLVLTVGEDEDYKAALKAHMEQEKFWPNAWFISDHGNAHLIEFSE